MFGAGDEVVQFVGVGLGVVEFFFGTGGDQAGALLRGEFAFFVERENGLEGGAAGGVGGWGLRQVVVVVADVFVTLVAYGAHVVFKVVPVFFGVDVIADGFVWISQQREEAVAFEGITDVGDSGGIHGGAGDVDRADELGRATAGFDLGWPVDDPRGFDAAVVNGGFVTREGAAVVAEEKNQSVFGDALFFQFGHYTSDVFVEAGDFIIIDSVVFARLRGVGVIGSDADVFGLGSVSDDVFVVRAMRVEGGEPEEERFVFVACPHQGDPVGAAALGFALQGFFELPSFGCFAGG